MYFVDGKMKYISSVESLTVYFMPFQSMSLFTYLVAMSILLTTEQMFEQKVKKNVEMMIELKYANHIYYITQVNIHFPCVYKKQMLLTKYTPLIPN